MHGTYVYKLCTYVCTYVHSLYVLSLSIFFYYNNVYICYRQHQQEFSRCLLRSTSICCPSPTSDRYAKLVVCMYKCTCISYVTRSAKINHVRAQKLPALLCYNSRFSYANKTKFTSHMQKFMENLLKLTE